MTPEERERLLADGIHGDLDEAAETRLAGFLEGEAREFADQLQVHTRLSALLRARDLAPGVVRELRYEEDAPRFAAGVVDRLAPVRRSFPRLASVAAAALIVSLTGWLVVQSPSTPPGRPSALLVVGDRTLGDGDRAVIDRLERLGFSVDTTTPDALELKGRTLVLLSSTVLAEDVLDDSGLLRSRFTTLAVPVLTWEPRLFSELGFTAKGVHGTDWAADRDQVRLRIADPAHPLAAGLSGTVDVTLAPGRLSWGRVGGAAVRAAVLEHDPGKAALFGYERGMRMGGGLPAPARRVGLFLFDDTAARLTGPGGQLFDAAVRWCAGIP